MPEINCKGNYQYPDTLDPWADCGLKAYEVVRFAIVALAFADKGMISGIGDDVRNFVGIAKCSRLRI